MRSTNSLKREKGAVADPEGGCSITTSKIGHNLAKLASIFYQFWPLHPPPPKLTTLDPPLRRRNGRNVKIPYTYILGHKCQKKEILCISDTCLFSQLFLSLRISYIITNVNFTEIKECFPYNNIFWKQHLKHVNTIHPQSQ